MKNINYFSMVFQYVRKRKKLTQTELARLLSVNQSTICRIERGIQVPRVTTVAKLEGMMKMSVRQMYRLSVG